MAQALLRACRPKQWTKNVLVLVAPVAAGVITQPWVLLHVMLAFVAFTLASSAVYLINDLRDLPLDRAHPVKRLRPIAAGQLPVAVARAAVPVMLVAAVGVALIDSWSLAGIVVLYEATSILYCLCLKNVAVLELMFVVAGFLLRAVGGGVAAHVGLSRWFFLTIVLGALFVVAGKRYAELELYAGSVARTRPVLAAYTLSYLRFIWTMAASAVIVAYALWGFSTGTANSNSWRVISIAPFLIALLRYAMIVDKGGAGEPEEIFLGDRLLLTVGGVWVACLLASVYL